MTNWLLVSSVHWLSAQQALTYLVLVNPYPVTFPPTSREAWSLALNSDSFLPLLQPAVRLNAALGSQAGGQAGGQGGGSPSLGLNARSTIVRAKCCHWLLRFFWPRSTAHFSFISLWLSSFFSQSNSVYFFIYTLFFFPFLFIYLFVYFSVWFENFRLFFSRPMIFLLLFRISIDFLLRLQRLTYFPLTTF